MTNPTRRNSPRQGETQAAAGRAQSRRQAQEILGRSPARRPCQTPCRVILLEPKGPRVQVNTDGPRKERRREPADPLAHPGTRHGYTGQKPEGTRIQTSIGLCTGLPSDPGAPPKYPQGSGTLLAPGPPGLTTRAPAGQKRAKSGRKSDEKQTKTPHTNAIPHKKPQSEKNGRHENKQRKSRNQARSGSRGPRPGRVTRAEIDQ